jgi:hypothetical protein
VNKWRRFRRLAPRQRWVLLQALALLPLAALGLRLVGFRRLQEWFARKAVSEPGAAGVPEPASMAQATARMVAAAAREGPYRGNCLNQSLVLCWLLRQQGLAGQLRIGVRKELDGLDAHAWVEYAGAVLNDGGDIASRYAPFEGDLATLPVQQR